MTRPRLALLALLAAPMTTVAAQQGTYPTSPRFVEILQLAQDGRGDSARTLIDRYLDRTPQSDPSYAEALYTAATLATSGGDARLLFSRVAVEHAQSAWADKALLRLAQLDYGTGDTDGAINRVRRLMLDYPDSPVTASAALWGARAAFERREYDTGCPWITRGLERVGDDVETRNQLEFMRQRCISGEGVQLTPIPQPAETLRVAPPVTRTPERRPVDTPEVKPPVQAPPPPPPAEQPKAAGPWRVQVAALSDAAAIRRLEGIIKKMGLTSYRVAGPGRLVKVQAGPFATREAATARVADLTKAVGGKPFVTRAP